jgi:hypothetical protein
MTSSLPKPLSILPLDSEDMLLDMDLHFTDHNTSDVSAEVRKGKWTVLVDVALACGVRRHSFSRSRLFSRAFLRACQLLGL